MGSYLSWFLNLPKRTNPAELFPQLIRIGVGAVRVAFCAQTTPSTTRAFSTPGGIPLFPQKAINTRTTRPLPRNLPRCGAHLSRACFCIGASAGKLFEGSFPKGIRAHDLLVLLVRANVVLERASQPCPFRELPRATNCGAIFSVDITYTHVCLSGSNKNTHLSACLSAGACLVRPKEVELWERESGRSIDVHIQSAHHKDGEVCEHHVVPVRKRMNQQHIDV